MASGRLAIGLMSGTSSDGIDAALLRTDGRSMIETLAAVFLPYEPHFRNRLREAMHFARAEYDEARFSLLALEEELTLRHVDAVAALLAEAGLTPSEVDVIGFHGQTLFHDPKRGISWQMGDGPLLARMTGIDVVHDFRAADIAGGGEGAPLAPGYHRALIESDPMLKRPVVILNIGGVANLSYIDATHLIAFDCGPGNALLDDWMLLKTGHPIDLSGHLARSGRVDQARIAALLAHPFFDRPPPKSLDRDAFSLADFADMAPADGAATLTAFTVEAVCRALAHLPGTPQALHVTGGGRHNGLMMESLARRSGRPVAPVEALGWQGDFIEAEAFAWLAVRHLLGLPLSWPGTTGVREPMPGGRLASARRGESAPPDRVRR